MSCTLKPRCIYNRRRTCNQSARAPVIILQSSKKLLYKYNFERKKKCIKGTYVECRYTREVTVEAYASK